MPSITIHNLSEEVLRALKLRAAANQRSMVAEVRQILISTLFPENRLRLGSAMAVIGREAGITDKEATIIEQSRDRTPAEPIDLS